MPKLIIPGPEGRIEARYEGHADETATLALILHPHPQHNGTMDNTVTFLMFHTFLNAGFNVLRYNSRGVGASEGGGVGRLSLRLVGAVRGECGSARDAVGCSPPLCRSGWWVC